MGIRSMPFFKGKKGYQFAGGGVTSDGGGAIEPATTETLGGVIVGNGLDVTSNGLLSFARKIDTEFDTGLKTHDNKTIYGAYCTRSVDASSGSNSRSMGEIVGRTSSIIDIFGYVKDSGDNRNSLTGWLMYNNHVVVLKYNAESAGTAILNLLVLYTKN